MIGNLIPRGPASSPWGWGVWEEGDAFWVPRTSHKCAVAWSMVPLALGSPINWALRGFWAAGNTPALKLLAHYSRSRLRQVPSSPKTKGPRWRDVLGFPGQLRLAELLAAGFESMETMIDTCSWPHAALPTAATSGPARRSVRNMGRWCKSGRLSEMERNLMKLMHNLC